MIVGRLPTQNGVLDYLVNGKGCVDDGIEYLHKEITYTDVLSKHGYFCALSGKYHLGYDSMTQHSFKHWHTWGGRGRYTDPLMVTDSECVKMEGYTTDIIADGAIEFLNSYTKKGSADPFYLSVHFTAPHAPHVGVDGRADSMHPKKYVDLYEKALFVSCPQQKLPPRSKLSVHPLSKRCHNNRECLKGYYAAVTGMDVNIGRIMDTVHKLNLDQKTLVVFASDHGYNAGHHGLWGKGNAGYPLNVYETSLRIPLIWHHTGTIEPGVEESVVQVLDIAPTLLDYAGKFIFPTKSNIPGESFADLLLRPAKRNSKSRKARTIYGEYGATRFIRINATTKYVSRLTENQKLSLTEDHKQELFDLTHDRNETINLIVSKDGEYGTELLQSYEKSLRGWFAKYEDKDISSWRELVTGYGQRRPITYKYTPGSSSRGTQPFKSSNS